MNSRADQRTMTAAEEPIQCLYVKPRLSLIGLPGNTRLEKLDR